MLGSMQKMRPRKSIRPSTTRKNLGRVAGVRCWRPSFTECL